jgi:hypothetical protein
MAKLTANVVVVDPETSAPVLLEAGSDVPEWAEDQVGDHVLEGESGNDSRKGEGHGEKSAGNPPPLQGAGSSKAKWAEYAHAHGVHVGDDMSRDEIADACRKAGVPVE